MDQNISSQTGKPRSPPETRMEVVEKARPSFGSLWLSPAGLCLKLGVPEDVAKEALTQAAYKLPIKCKVVKKAKV